jgi:hypothetical protein
MGTVAMERGDGGYMRVVAGMPDPADRLPPSAGRRLKDEDRRALVERLRHQGWSYRRISDELNISYATVSRWLDGPEATDLPVSSLPVSSLSATPLPIRLAAPPAVRAAPLPPAGLPEPESASPLLEHLVAQNRALLQRVDQLAAAEAARTQAVADLELRLVAAMEEQHKRLGERLLESIKLLLRKLVPR